MLKSVKMFFKKESILLFCFFFFLPFSVEASIHFSSDFSSDLLQHHFISKWKDQRHHAPSLIEGGEVPLSDFWAQHRIGADLVNLYLKQKNSQQLYPHFIGIIDSFRNVGHGIPHGERVSGFISGPFASLPAEIYGISEHERSEELVQLFFDHQYRYFNASNAGSCNDRTVFNSHFDRFNLASRLYEENETIWINASGNNWGNPIDDETRILLDCPNAEYMIFAGATNSLGFIAAYADNSFILVPIGHYSVLPLDSGEVFVGGGTSYAAPSVTSALGAFHIVSNYHPSLEEAKTLIEKTSIPTISRYENLSTNIGSLNAYKLVMVAERLKSLCGLAEYTDQDRKSCMQKWMEDDDLYHFKIDRTAYKNIKSDVLRWDIYRDCIKHPMKDHISHSFAYDDNYGDKDDLLREIRKEALLTLNPPLWQLLSCIYQKEGLEMDAYYYHLTASILENRKSLKQKDRDYKDYAYTEFTAKVAYNLVSSEKFHYKIVIQSILRLNLPESIVLDLLETLCRNKKNREELVAYADNLMGGRLNISVPWYRHNIPLYKRLSCEKSISVTDLSPNNLLNLLNLFSLEI